MSSSNGKLNGPKTLGTHVPHTEESLLKTVVFIRIILDAEVTRLDYNVILVWGLLNDTVSTTRTYFSL
jgi:hypothetical protein